MRLHPAAPRCSKVTRAGGRHQLARAVHGEQVLAQVQHLRDTQVAHREHPARKRLLSQEAAGPGFAPPSPPGRA